MFIVIEGIDGSGKTTQAKMLVDRLNDAGRKAVYLKEPTEGEWGRKIEQIARHGRENVTPEEELQFFLNDRAEDVAGNILPAIESGATVVMDRYFYSNMAYQGALGIDVEFIYEKNRDFPKPDIAFFIDIKPEEGLERIKLREGRANTGYEKIEFLEKVHQVFSGPRFNSMVRLDGTQSVEQIHELIYREVSRLIP